MKSEMEKLLGKPIGIENSIPGTITREGRGVIYYSDDGKTDFKEQFSNLTKNIGQRLAKHGGRTSKNCKLWIPDGTLLHPVSYHGDLDGWKADLRTGIQNLGLIWGEVENNYIKLSDGRSIPLEKCKIEFF